jgi:hypothetical protein
MLTIQNLLRPNNDFLFEESSELLSRRLANILGAIGNHRIRSERFVAETANQVILFQL